MKENGGKANDMNGSEDKLIHQTRQVLDARADQLDGKIVARLRAARLRAVEEARIKNERPAWIRPVGGLVTATLVVGIATTLWMANPSVPKHGIEDIELLASAETRSFIRIWIFIFGWRSARVPVKRLMMALAILIVVPSQAEETPDMEMLEYLGNWETANGDYIDPMELKTEDLKEESKESNEQ